MTSTPRFALPGSWGRINLATDRTTQSSIRKVVEHAIGRDDNLATLRADLRKQFASAAEIARANSAVDFHIALELAPGVPLPAWLGVFLPDIDSTDFAALGLTELQTALGTGLALTDGEEAVGTKALSVGKIKAVRQAFHRIRPATDDEPALELLQVDYWLAAAAPNRLALLTFTTNYVDFEDQMLELFDAVISTVRWPAPALSTAPVAETVAG